MPGGPGGRGGGFGGGMAGGNPVAIDAPDKGVLLWDLAQKKKVAVLTGLDKTVSQLAFAADGNTLAALAADGTTIHVWDLKRNGTLCQMTHNRGSLGMLTLAPDGKTLAATANEGKVVLLWNVTARHLAPKGTAVELSAKELEGLWADLADVDAVKANAAWQKLGVAGDGTIDFLRQHIRSVAVPKVDVKQIEKWVADLDSDKFALREKASVELAAAGEPAIACLQRLLEKSPSAEAEKRAKVLLKKLGEPVMTPERQRVLEALDLLEQLRTPEAMALLREIERDALIQPIRIAARQALERATAQK
jgi:hypothetical protein